MAKYELCIYGQSYSGFGGAETFVATITAMDAKDLKRRYRNIKRQIAYNAKRKRRPKHMIIESVEYAE